MSFLVYQQEPIDELIRSAGGDGKITLLVGAGASMEAGLPSWDKLLDRLLLRGGESAGLIETVAQGQPPTPEQAVRRARWLAEAARDGPLGKAALAETLAGSNRDCWIEDALFEDAVTGEHRGPDDYYPGPIARQIPVLLDAFGTTDLRIMTLNYDDLLEQACRQDGRFEPYAISTEDHRVPAGKVGVFHLHGYLGRDGRPAGQLVLSEADYMQMQRGASWQEQLVGAAFRDSTVVFVGTSMLDPNVIRYLHGVTPPTGEQHARFALFVRQGTYEKEVPEDIRRARERALGQRWEALGVAAVFVDHYTDVAQILAEIARRRRLGPDAYMPLPGRAAEWIGAVQRDILGWYDDERFRDGQRVVNHLLRNALARAVAAAERLGGQAWGETLQLALWLVDPDGEKLTNWVMTDRLHLDRQTIEPVDIDEYANWVAVRSFCAGTPLAQARDIYASRWRFVRGTPLVLESERHGRIPVGCLTTASLSPRSETQLDAMRGEVLTAFNEAVSDAVITLLDQPFAVDL